MYFQAETLGTQLQGRRDTTVAAILQRLSSLLTVVLAPCPGDGEVWLLLRWPMFVGAVCTWSAGLVLSFRHFPLDNLASYLVSLALVGGAAEIREACHHQRGRCPVRVDRGGMWVAILAAWMLWQEIEFLDQPDAPSWHLEGRFSGETACHEARRIRIVERVLGADNGGPTVLNRPTLEEGVLWVRWPDGLSAKLRYICLPEPIEPEVPWFGHQRLDPGGQKYVSR